MIGILGGTFDPIHYGHLRTALDVQQALCLNEIRLVPLRDPPHRESPLTSPQQRLEMVRLAVADNPRFRVDDRELMRTGKSYTVDTLSSLREELGEVPLCLLMGGDAFRSFSSWRRPQRILELAHLVVMTRPGYAGLRGSYADRITQDPACLSNTLAGLILLQPVTALDISSTSIRRLVVEKRSPRYLLPDRVLEHIQARGYYQYPAGAQR